MINTDIITQLKNNEITWKICNNLFNKNNYEELFDLLISKNEYYLLLRYIIRVNSKNNQIFKSFSIQKKKKIINIIIKGNKYNNLLQEFIEDNIIQICSNNNSFEDKELIKLYINYIKEYCLKNDNKITLFKPILNYLKFKLN